MEALSFAAHSFPSASSVATSEDVNWFLREASRYGNQTTP
jgi:hypothetical protein